MVLHKYLFIVILFISAHFKSNAQDEAVSRNMHSAGVNAAITSSDTWQLEAAYHGFRYAMSALAAVSAIGNSSARMQFHKASIGG